MMITEDAVLVVYKLLKAVITDPVYKYARPKNATQGTYYVINSLPVGSGLLQKCVVNVNAYCDDVAPGEQDTEKLQTMSQLVISTLDDKSNTGKTIFLYFQQQNTFVGEEFQNHYSNMRFDAKLLNI